MFQKAKNHQALLHAPYYGVSVENTAINLTIIIKAVVLVDSGLKLRVF
ncbi:hypothetical protein N197_00175 [Helicobacter pylori UM023]|nr:hypothetical protein N197_00175 [Helicobacter pylori UM023]